MLKNSQDTLKKAKSGKDANIYAFKLILRKKGEIKKAQEIYKLDIS